MTAKLGIALSGGGARGIIHIGILKVLLRHRIGIDALSGTSAGAIVAASYGCNTLNKLEKFVIGLKKRELLNFFSRPALSQGFFDEAYLQNWLEQLFQGRKFEDLEIPIAIVAADLKRGKEVIFTKGPISTAVMASCSVPGIFTPLKYKGMLLIDGGVINNLPVDVLPQIGAEVVVGVDVENYMDFLRLADEIKHVVEKINDMLSCIRIPFKNTLSKKRMPQSAMIQKSVAAEKKQQGQIKKNLKRISDVALNERQRRLLEKYTMKYIILRSLKIYYNSIRTSRKKYEADLIISPQFANISSFNFFRAEQAILLGEKYGEKYVSLIKKMVKEF